MKNLTEQQRSELIEQYVELITDSMDVKTLEQFVRDTLTDDFNKLSNSELQDEIKYSFDEEILDELIAQYSQLVIDSMDVESLEQFVYNTLKDDFTALSNSELQDEIKYSFDEETLDELVDNVTTNSKELIYTDEQKRLTTLEELGG